MNVILISGKSKSGKDVAADYIAKKGGDPSFVRTALADILKSEVSAKYQVPLDYFNHEAYKEAPLLQYPVYMDLGEYNKLIHTDSEGRKFFTPRSLLILEAEQTRLIDPAYYLKRMISSVAQNKQQIPNLVISDVRLKIEMDVLKKAFPNAKTLRLNRDNHNKIEHYTETQLDDYTFDFTIENNGTKEELYTQLDSIINSLKEKKDESQTA